MDPGVWVALIAVFGAQLGALILQFQSARQRREETASAAKERRDERQQDFDRSEAVRKAVEDAATKADHAAALLAERDRRQKEEADRAAGKAREAAALLVEAQEESIRRTNEVARLAKIADKAMIEKLDGIDAQTKRIHTLVNSDMTAARSDLLDQMVVVRDLMMRMAAADRAAGVEPSDADALTLAKTEQRIADQRAILADRAAQQAQVEKDRAELIEHGQPVPQDEAEEDKPT